jgi:SAM-dependent methyltransferase
MNAEACRVYEREDVRRATGDTIRPGGLALTDRALGCCALPAGARVVDVGCGLGETVAHLIARHGLSALGVDPSALLLRTGRHQDSGRPLIRAVGERLPFAAGALDAVVAECSLSLITDVDQALAEFHRVLRGGGVVIVGDVYARNPAAAESLGRLPFASCVRGAMPRQHVIDRFQAHGFNVALWEDHTEALKRLAVEIIMAHGSLDWFWCRASGGAADPQVIRAAITRAQPGYFLLVAVKHAV